VSEPKETVIEILDLASEYPEEKDLAGAPQPTDADPTDVADVADVAEAVRPAASEDSEEIQRRHASGEFEAAVEAFETLPYEEYRKFVGHAIRHLDGNRYYVNLDGDLYVYSGGSDPEHRHFLCRLNRPA
jgi:hypothetical protein